MKERDKYLNVYNNGIYKWIPRFWFTNIKQYFHNRKMAKQRAKWGWCVEDTWDIENWLLRVLPEMIKYQREHTNGTPVDLNEIQWDGILAEIEHSLYDALEDHNEDNIFADQFHKVYNLCRVVTKNSNGSITVDIDPDKAKEHDYEDIRMAMIREEQRRIRERQRKLKHGMMLLSKWLPHMWW